MLYNLRGEHEALSSAVSHEPEKGDLLFNILGSLLQEVCDVVTVLCARRVLASKLYLNTYRNGVALCS